MIKKPLEGFQVLEYGESALSAICSLMLSDFGAAVIKIEDCTSINNINIERSSYVAQNHGKKISGINPFSPNDRISFYELIKNSDAIITDHMNLVNTPELNYETLKSINEKLVYTFISGYGMTGSFSNRLFSDQTIQAESGIMSITGEEYSDPVLCGAPIAQHLGASIGCIGTLMAVIEAEKKGHGRFVDVSAMDSLLFGLENQFSMYLKTDRIPLPIGNNYHLSAPVGVFPCKDGELTISVATHSQWIAFAETLKHTEWLSDPRFATVQDRIKNYPELNELVTEAFASYTYDELIIALQNRHCIYGRVNSIADVVTHPQVQHRQTFVSAKYEDGVIYTVPATPIRMNGMTHETTYLVPSNKG